MSDDRIEIRVASITVPELIRRKNAAERECVQLRADNDRWREQGIAWVDQHVALARENDQLRAERDQALTLLRAVRELPFHGDAWIDVTNLIDRSGLLDDEGQQR